ncbi:hypothetical protein ACFUJR_16175 [Streptomyces sp. NPDC057271]|uniref:hypothetical protein n=1 Tax=unclassified Streptomyces TaxID=2593676 RepID=UPI00362B0204
MSMEKPQPPRRPDEPEGCLTAVIRIPVRIVVLVIVVPVRMIWDVLVVGARALDRTVLRPTGRALTWLGRALFVRPWVWLWRQVVLPTVHHTLVVPAVWLYRRLLTPLGHGLIWLLTALARALGVGLGWLGMALFVWPWVALWRYVVVPVARYGIGAPAVWVYRWILAPLGAGVSFLLDRLWRYVVVPAARYGIALPLAWLYRHVLTPVGRGLAWSLSRIWRGASLVLGALWRGLVAVGASCRGGGVWLGKALFVWPWVALWRYGVVPVVRYGVVVPLVWLYRRVLTPVGRELLDALRVCWRVAGFVSRAVGRALAWVVRNLVGRPAAWFYRSVCAPVGHWVRDQVWAPARRAAVAAGQAAREGLAAARATVRQARRDAWRALVGGPRVTEPVEPVVASARTLGSTTTASGAAPVPEISLRKRG